jgi:hypothetical protein
MQDYGRRTTDFFESLNKDSLALIDDFYDPSVTFCDPLGEGSGRARLHRHYARMFKHIGRLEYRFPGVMTMGSQVFVQWVATIRHARLNRGRDITLNGSTWLEFGGPEDKVIRFREYFDLGELAYENLFLLGPVVRAVKRILRG